MKKLVTIFLFLISINSIAQQQFFWSYALRLAVVTTGQPTGVSGTEATLHGNVIDTVATVVQKGFVLSQDESIPTLETASRTYGCGSYGGEYEKQLTDLDEETTYFVRAYVTNSAGTAYGDVYSVTTGVADMIPTVWINGFPTNITSSSATAYGNVVSDGGDAVTARGYIWSTSSLLDWDNKAGYTSDGTGTGTFSSSITGLSQNTRYFIRPYATNSVGRMVSNMLSFTTLAGSPTVTTSSATNIAAFSATSGGNVTADNGSFVTERGVCWNTSTNPTTSNSKANSGTGTGSYSVSLTNLSQNTLYYTRAYAINSSGTSYGSNVTFTTETSSVPTVTLTSITSITSTTASSGGEVTNSGYGSVTARGVCWSTSQNPTIADNRTENGTGTGVFISSIIGLSASTTYYVRAYATNENGTGYSSQSSFSTIGLPVLTTVNISDVTSTTASSGGNITSDGGSSVTARGVCWSTSQNPTINNSKTTNGTGTGFYTSSLTSLSGGTYYYVRAYATNSAGTAYGDQKGFMTSLLCNSQTNYTGGVSYPTTILIELGTGTGYVTLNYNAYDVPDKFIVEYDGNQVINTGYRGRTDFQSELDAVLQPSETITGGGDGNITFNKSSSVSNAYVEIYAPMSSTGWTMSMSCPSATAPPVVTTGTASSITSSSFTVSGNVTQDYGATVTERGIIYARCQNCAVIGYGTKVTNSSGTGSYSNTATGLSSGTTYYVRAYAINSKGTSFGNEISVTTLPIVTLITPFDKTGTTATSGGSVTSDGDVTITSRGVCWVDASLGRGATINDSKTIDGSGTGSFISFITGLSPAITYNIRAYAVSSLGVFYSGAQSF